MRGTENPYSWHAAWWRIPRAQAVLLFQFQPHLEGHLQDNRGADTIRLPAEVNTLGKISECRCDGTGLNVKWKNEQHPTSWKASEPEIRHNLNTGKGQQDTKQWRFKRVKK